ncbi:MAG: arsenate reductase ArsC [Nitrososphaerota archaeon]|nr:arsenate reductase ArsC [Nitrososphaerales archaeon]MDW8045434.1 arsenate reductase ArsC [Nitrososphaerota archaeon]
MKVILFVCVENSFRSQIAEAYFNKFAPKGWKAKSAGLVIAESINPNAVKLMLEEGIDISSNRPKLMTRELQEEATMVIIVCSSALCPVVYAKHVEEWDIPDPAKMSLEEARRVRDMIKERVLKLIERLESQRFEDRTAKD